MRANGARISFEVTPPPRSFVPENIIRYLNACLLVNFELFIQYQCRFAVLLCVLNACVASCEIVKIATTLLNWGWHVNRVDIFLGAEFDRDIQNRANILGTV